jgi:hypothetical protein
MFTASSFRSLGVFGAALVAVLLTRLLPHWPNFTAVGAFALGSAVWFNGSRWSGILALAGLYATDLVLSNTVYASVTGWTWGYSGMVWTYSAWALLVVLGQWVPSNGKIGRWTALAATGSAVFFVLTNTGSWLGSPLYPQTATGLGTALLAGLPFAGSFFAATWLYGVAYAAVSRSILPAMGAAKA